MKKDGGMFTRYYVLFGPFVVGARGAQFPVSSWQDFVS